MEKTDDTCCMKCENPYIVPESSAFKDKMSTKTRFNESRSCNHHFCLRCVGKMLNKGRGCPNCGLRITWIPSWWRDWVEYRATAPESDSESDSEESC